jgi:hypothetical protein
MTNHVAISALTRAKQTIGHSRLVEKLIDEALAALSRPRGEVPDATTILFSDAIYLLNQIDKDQLSGKATTTKEWHGKYEEFINKLTATPQPAASVNFMDVLGNAVGDEKSVAKMKAASEVLTDLDETAEQRENFAHGQTMQETEQSGAYEWEFMHHENCKCADCT